MRIITYNVNGIRSAVTKNFLDWVSAAQPDVLCIQEARASCSPELVQSFSSLGYDTYWHQAQQKGYSGVSTFSKHPSSYIEKGIAGQYDPEARFLRTDIEDLSIINVYVPAGSASLERLVLKHTWLNHLYEHIQNLIQQGKSVILCGDFNICHLPIDIHHPRHHQQRSGYLDSERNWFSRVLDLGFIDTFRQFNSEPHHYTWWPHTPLARKHNLGWRIDYILATLDLKNRLKRSMILSEARHSDHCPVLLDLN